MHPVDWVGRVTRTNLALSSHKKFQPNFKRLGKGRRSWNEFWREIQETKQT